MQYAPGEPRDEKTHAAYHAAVLTGIRFQVKSDICWHVSAMLPCSIWIKVSAS